jgi:hypothetical protein
MRTTVRIDDELLRRLRESARAERVSLTNVLNRTLRSGLERAPAKTRRRGFAQRTFDFGGSNVDLTKALALAGALEDEEVLDKLRRRK